MSCEDVIDRTVLSNRKGGGMVESVDSSGHGRFAHEGGFIDPQKKRKIEHD